MMHNLAKVIGKAPSEMTKAELIEKLDGERRRVTASLASFRAAPAVKPTKATTKKSKVKASVTKKAELLDALKMKAESMGITVPELMAIIKNKQQS